jgi:hypothetical protein
MLTIPLSHLDGKRAEFEVAVANYIHAMVAFGREEGKPRPTAHSLVELAVKRIEKKGKPDDYAADYTIVDDTPVVTLADKKLKCHAAIVAAENAARYKILPERRVRLVSIQHGIATAKPEAERTDADKAAISFYEDVSKKWNEITLLGATAEAALEDLTDDTVDTWSPPQFG